MSEIEKDLRKASKIAWTSSNPEHTENLKLGCLLRIADGVDLMAKNHDELVRSRTSAIERVRVLEGRILKLNRRVSGLRGVITRMKRRGK